MTRLLRVSTLVLVTAAMFVADALPVRAQTSDAVASAETLFADAAAKEAAVRKALVTDEPLPTLLKAVRTVVADYENVVRRYPTSGFSDDALWRAGKLARDAFDEFQEARERSTALRLLQLLQSGYPSSKLVKAVPEQLAWLNAHPATASAAASAQTAPVAAPAPDTVQGPLAARRADAVPQASSSKVADAPASASAPTATAARLVNIKAIRRAVLKDVVRIVIELDSEVPFHDERIENPTRIFVDLPSTRANPSLIDQTLRFDGDSDIVRQVRVGRHPNSTTRVVLEAAGVSSYSVYPLYSPFRLVIDCLRDGQQVASADPGRPPVDYSAFIDDVESSFSGTVRSA